jgi:predicted 2-oxoglutarate/Fe(II)-dependent dioxygenase YbiX
MIIELSNWVNKETTARIRSAVESHLVGTQDDYATYRDGKTVAISKTPELQHIDQELHKIFSGLHENILSRRYNPSFPVADSGYEFHRYLPGDVCHYHADGEVADKMLRFASVTLHLSTVDNGGELVFPEQNKSVKTEEGKIVVFPPYGSFGHYTTPSDQVRDVIVFWFVYKNIKVERVL